MKEEGKHNRALKMKVLMTGGGTGGHIYPALALIKRIKELHADAEFLYVGTERGLESRIVPAYGVTFKPLNVEGFSRDLSFKGLKSNLKTVKLFLQSIKKAKKIIDEFDPDVVVGTGGYVSAPVCYAASKKNVPTIIHEQNSVVGITNKFLSRYASAIAICFEEARSQFKGKEDKVHFTGNPRAQEVAGLEPTDCLTGYQLDPEKETVLIFGGSRGAGSINETVVKSWNHLTSKPYQVLFVTGEDYYKDVSEELSTYTKGKKTAKIVSYIQNLPEVFASVSLVVSRSGATTLSEITSLGVPSVLIPSPNVTEDHQTKNAQSLEREGAAVLIKESNLTEHNFIETIDGLMLNSEKRKNMAKESIKLGKQNASDLLIQVMLDLLK